MKTPREVFILCFQIIFILSLLLSVPGAVAADQPDTTLPKGFVPIDLFGSSYYEEDDYASALKTFKFFAEAGDVEAQNYMGARYENGQGVPQDYKVAVKGYKKAADQGNTRAQANLGLTYGHYEPILLLSDSMNFISPSIRKT